MEFIEKVLGLDVSRQPWEHLQKMPYYIQDRFTIEKVALGNIATLFIYPKTELDHTAALQKHIARIISLALTSSFAFSACAETTGKNNGNNLGGVISGTSYVSTTINYL